MGFYKLLALLICLTVLLTPLIALKGTSSQKQEPESEELTEQTIPETKIPQKVRVLITQTDKVEEMTVEEYLVGVLAAEMPANYHQEALKAQAVAAYTYLLYKMEQSGGEKADISDDPSTHQGYIGSQVRQEKWGNKSQSYEKKLTEAVQSVSGKYISHAGKPIMAAVHAISSGQTRSAKAVWGGEVSYLQSVPSPGDKLSPDCVKTVAFTAAEFSELAASLDGCVLNGEASEWMGEIETDSSGYVTKMNIGSGIYNGLQVRAALGLRSAMFTAEYTDGSFRFTTTGYGHGVGLSQYGADYMARQGSTWEEIIKHYYSAVSIA